MKVEPQTIERHFNALCELSREQRAEAIRQLMDQDEALARRVAALLDAHDGDTIGLEALRKQGALGISGLDFTDLVGSELGGWRLTEELGRGGLGVVYRAERERDGVQENAALKVLSVPMFENQVGQHFLREAAVLARLNHPGICRLRDFGRSEQGWPFLVLDLVDGQPIDLAAKGMGLTERIKLMIQVAEAVGAAHRQLIVHLDIKPDNILVTPRGRPVLLDFGISRVLGERNDGATVTLMRWLTPDYASPEQLRGESATVAADLYSLGAVLYELLTGRRPFDLNGLPITEALERIERGAPPPSRLVSGCGKDLDAIIAKATHPDPVRRYASAANLADDLRAVLDHRPVAARPDSLGYRLTKLFQRNPIAAPTALTSFVAIAVLTIMLALQANDLRLQRDHAERETTRARAATDLLLGSIRAADPTGVNATATTVGDLLDAAVTRIERNHHADRGLLVASLSQIAEVHRSLGERQEAIELYRRAMDMVNEATAIDGEERVAVVAGLAGALREGGQPDEARLLLEDEMAQLAEPGHWQLWMTRGNLRFSQGRMTQAQSDLERALAMVPDSAHGSRASILNSLGLIEDNAGRYRESLDWLARAAETVRISPVDRELLATILLNTANAQARLGRIDEALASADESLGLRIDMFGERHIQTIPSHLIQAYVLLEAGRWDDAIETARHTAELEQELTGGDTPRMAAIWSAIALAAERKGDYDTARDGFERALDVQSRLLPPDHPALAGTRVNLASTLMAQGQYRASLEPLKKAWEVHTAAALGQPSRPRAIAAVNIAYSYLRLQEPEPALQWSAEAWAEAQQVLEPDQWLLGHFRNVHAEALLANGSVAEAEHHALAVEQVYAASEIPVRPKSQADNLRLLARIYQHESDADRAAVYESRLAELQASSPDTS